MSTTLVRGIQDVTPYIKVKNQSMQSPFAYIDCTEAEQQHIVPVIGATLYNDLLTKVNGVNYPFSDEEIKLLVLIRGTAVYFTYAAAMPMLQVEFSELGIRSNTGSEDDKQPLYKWQFNEVRDDLLSNAYKYKEAVLNYVSENAGAFSNWTNDELTNTFFITSIEFNKYYQLKNPALTFGQLQAIIKEAEAVELADNIGEEAVADLITQSKNTGASVVYKKAIDLARRYVVSFSINKAIERLSVSLTAQGFTILNGEAPDTSYNGRRDAGNNRLSFAYESSASDASKYLKALKSYMNEKASDDVFAAYKASSYYTSPTTEPVQVNNNKKVFLF